MHLPGRVVIRTARFESFEERWAMTAQPWACLLSVPSGPEPWDEQPEKSSLWPLSADDVRIGEAEQGGATLAAEASLAGSPLVPLSSGLLASVGQQGTDGISRDQPGKRFGLDGTGQTVAIIDSGIAYDHPALGGGLGTRYQVVGGWDFAEQDADPYDDAPFGFHGTHIAGILGSQAATARGVAPGVDLVALRVFDDQGMGQWEWVEQALQWVEAHRQTFAHPITTVNLSVGSLPSHPNTSQWRILEDEFQRLRDSGVVVVVAAGNGFAEQSLVGLNLPAASRWVVPVASVDAQGRLSSFSQRQADILAAPGELVYSTVPDYLLGADGNRNDFERASGTSMAAPYVTGASVLVRQAMQQNGTQPITPERIQQHLQATAITRQDPQTGIRYYQLDLDRALQQLITVQGPSATASPSSVSAAGTATAGTAAPATAAPATAATGTFPASTVPASVSAAGTTSTGSSGNKGAPGQTQSNLSLATGTAPQTGATQAPTNMPLAISNVPGLSLQPAGSMVFVGPVFSLPTSTQAPVRLLGVVNANQRVTGSLDRPDQRDTFTFTAGQDGTVIVTPNWPQSAGWRLGEIGSITPASNRELRLTVRRDSSYTVSFDSVTRLGPYELEFRFEPSIVPIDLGTQTSWNQTKVKAGSAWYRVTAAHTAMLTVTAQSGADVGLTLYNAQLKPLTQIAPSQSPRLDISAKAGQTYLVHVTSQAQRFDIAITNSVSRAHSVTTIRGSHADDTIEIDTANQTTIRINNTEYTLPKSKQIVVEAAGGSDRVRIVRPGESAYEFRGVEKLEEVETIAYHLARDLRLRLATAIKTNDLGWQERWFTDRQDQRYFITPTGQLYRWNGDADLNQSVPFAQLDKRFYKNTGLLTEASRPDRLIELEAAHWAAHWKIQLSARDHYNWGGQQERWLRGGDQQMLFITPDGTLYRWSGRRDLAGSTRIAQFDATYYHDLQRLVSARQSAAEQEQLRGIVSALRLQSPLRELDHSLGWNERWWLAADGKRYFLTPTGGLYQAQVHAQGASLHSWVASLGSYYYHNHDQVLKLAVSVPNLTVLSVGRPEPSEPLPLASKLQPAFSTETVSQHAQDRPMVKVSPTEEMTRAPFDRPESTARPVDRPLHRAARTPLANSRPDNESIQEMIDLVASIRTGQIDEIESSASLSHLLSDPPHDPLLEYLAVVRVTDQQLGASR